MASSCLKTSVVSQPLSINAKNIQLKTLFFLIPPFHWPTLIRWSWRPWGFSKKERSVAEVPRNVIFCGSWQCTTLFVRWYHTREDFAALILRPLCISIAFVSCFLYDQANQHGRKVWPRCACCVCCITGASWLVMRFYCTHGALLYKSASNCRIPSFIYGHPMPWNYLAMLQQSWLQPSFKKTSYPRSRN